MKMTPSASPATTLAAPSVNAEEAKAIISHDTKYGIAVSRMDFFRPMVSTIAAPKKHAGIGAISSITTIQEPSSLVIWKELELLVNCGSEGDGHA